MAEEEGTFPNAWANYAPSSGSGRGGPGRKGYGKFGYGKGGRGKGAHGQGRNQQGKGHVGDGPRQRDAGRANWDDTPDFSVIGDERKAELEAQIVTFHGGGNAGDDAGIATNDGTVALGGELAFPPTLSPLERRFVYSVVERLGNLTARGVGPKSDRRIVVAKGRPAVTASSGDFNAEPEIESDIQPAVLGEGDVDGARVDGQRDSVSSDVVSASPGWRNGAPLARHAGKSKAPGGKGKVSRGADQREDAITLERRMELEEELLALREGREPDAVPRVGDLVQVVRVLGSDPTHLEGRVGEVVGSVPTLDGDGAFTIRFAGDAAAFGENGKDLTVATSNLRVFEPRRPLGEGSLTMPKSFTGLERKAVHEIAEAMGLVAQSFGERADRYITVYRPSEGCNDNAVSGINLAPELAVATGGVRYSGVDLDVESSAALVQAITTELGEELSMGWRTLASRMVICRGPFSRPMDVDARHAKAGEDVLARVVALRPRDTVELRVVSVGRDKRAIAVGVLGVPALTRNPNVAVATAPGQPPWAADTISDWRPYRGPPIVLRGCLTEWADVDIGKTVADGGGGQGKG